jgi:hypothetical protein
MEDELIVVHSFGSRADADLAKSALEAAGIEAVVQSDDAGGLRPHLTFVNGAHLLVRAEDAEAAREILDLPAGPASM